jgi:hypothetical protein
MKPEIALCTPECNYIQTSAGENPTFYCHSPYSQNEGGCVIPGNPCISIRGPTLRRQTLKEVVNVEVGGRGDNCGKEDLFEFPDGMGREM